MVEGKLPENDQRASWSEINGSLIQDNSDAPVNFPVDRTRTSGKMNEPYRPEKVRKREGTKNVLADSVGSYRRVEVSFCRSKYVTDFS